MKCSTLSCYVQSVEEHYGKKDTSITEMETRLPEKGEILFESKPLFKSYLPLIITTLIVAFPLPFYYILSTTYGEAGIPKSLSIICNTSFALMVAGIAPFLYFLTDKPLRRIFTQCIVTKETVIVKTGFFGMKRAVFQYADCHGLALLGKKHHCVGISFKQNGVEKNPHYCFSNIKDATGLYNCLLSIILDNNNSSMIDHAQEDLELIYRTDKVFSSRLLYTECILPGERWFYEVRRPSWRSSLLVIEGVLVFVVLAFSFSINWLQTVASITLIIGVIYFLYTIWNAFKLGVYLVTNQRVIISEFKILSFSDRSVSFVLEDIAGYHYSNGRLHITTVGGQYDFSDDMSSKVFGKKIMEAKQRFKNH